MKVIRPKKAGGFTLVEIMIVVAIIGLIAAIAIPGMLRSRSRAQENTCIDNLRILDAAKQQWAIENRAAATATPTPAQVQSYVGRANSNLPLCPCDAQGTFATSYSLNDCSTAPSCLVVATHTLQ